MIDDILKLGGWSMFKKGLVSVTLGAMLLLSLSLWAKSNQEPTVVAKLQVENQLSISAHQGGEESFMQQVSTSKAKAPKQHVEESLPMSVLSVFWIMMLGLLFFVIRVSTQRIK